MDAAKATVEDRPVWRVTFYGPGVSAVHPGQVMIIVLDRRSGEIVSLGMS